MATAVSSRWQVRDVAPNIGTEIITDKETLLSGERAGVGEGVITAITEAGLGGKPLARVVGDDTYTPLGGAANTILPSDAAIVAAAAALTARAR